VSRSIFELGTSGTSKEPSLEPTWLVICCKYNPFRINHGLWYKRQMSLKILVVNQIEKFQPSWMWKVHRHFYKKRLSPISCFRIMYLKYYPIFFSRNSLGFLPPFFVSFKFSFPHARYKLQHYFSPWSCPCGNRVRSQFVENTVCGQECTSISHSYIYEYK
jgi:hypothetical protein